VGQRGHSKSRGFHFLYGKENKNHQFGTGFFVRHRTLPAVKSTQFISDRMSYIVVSGHWCNIILNVHAPCEEKTDN
jgi:hypothetical protein